MSAPAGVAEYGGTYWYRRSFGKLLFALDVWKVAGVVEYNPVMDRFSRFVAMLLIATLTLHLSDWPFVDELLEDARAQSVQLSDGAASDTDNDPADMQARVKLGLGFQSLNAFTNIIPPSAALPVFAAVATIDQLHRLEAIRAEFIVGAPFRPPAP